MVKREIADLYNRVAADYGQIGPSPFAEAGRRLVELAGVQPGWNVLDVAAGRGAVLFPAAKRAGPTGTVTGIDVAAKMVDETRRQIEREGVTNGQMLRMDAERLELGAAAYDAVLCSFAVFLFPDPERALRECWRVLKPSGRIGFAMAFEDDPRWGWYDDLLRRHAPAASLLRPDPRRSVRRRGELEAALRDVGFGSCRRIEEPIELTFADEAEWWDSLWTHGTRRPLDAMDEEHRARLRADAGPHLNELSNGGPIPRRLIIGYILAVR